MKIKGLIVAPFTPFKSDGSVNFSVIRNLAEHYTKTGVAGVFINGTTGESLSLAVEERIKLAEEWIKYARGDFKVIVHVGHNSIEACRQLASHAQQIGAWGIGAMGPCFFKPVDMDELVNYCGEIASVAPDLPFYYYHMPSMTGVKFAMADFLDAAVGKIPNLAGIKYTSEDLMDYRCCLNFEDGRFDILFGRDEILIAGLAMGAKGAVGSTYNYAASIYNQLIQAFNAGDMETACQLQDQAVEIVKVLKMPNTAELAVNKYIMNCFSGIDCGPVRTPIKNLTQTQKDTIRAKVSELLHVFSKGKMKSVRV